MCCILDEILLYFFISSEPVYWYFVCVCVYMVYMCVLYIYVYIVYIIYILYIWLYIDGLWKSLSPALLCHLPN